MGSSKSKHFPPANSSDIHEFDNGTDTEEGAVENDELLKNGSKNNYKDEEDNESSDEAENYEKEDEKNYKAEDELSEDFYDGLKKCEGYENDYNHDETFHKMKRGTETSTEQFVKVEQIIDVRDKSKFQSHVKQTVYCYDAEGIAGVTIEQTEKSHARFPTPSFGIFNVTVTPNGSRLFPSGMQQKNSCKIPSKREEKLGKLFEETIIKDNIVNQ